CRRGEHARQGGVDRPEPASADCAWSDRDTCRCAADCPGATITRAGDGRGAASGSAAAGTPTADPGGEAQDARGTDAQEAREDGAGGWCRMILTVPLNAAIDRTVAVPSFRQGHRHRAVEASTVAGGKGVNVARALKLLDRPVIATGLAGGPTGARLMERLAQEPSPTDLPAIAGASRT